mgnify:CR=1 FL=1|tara:strand:- start:88 stop:348 length:261 start_codon:yes stop_codon:yes gene_type:complete
MAITVTVNINDLNEKILLNDLLDIDDWVQAAVVGKINNCKKRMAGEATAILKADASVENMPATDDGLIEALLARSDYKDRAARDKE